MLCYLFFLFAELPSFPTRCILCIQQNEGRKQNPIHLEPQQERSGLSCAQDHTHSANSHLEKIPASLPVSLLCKCTRLGWLLRVSHHILLPFTVKGRRPCRCLALGNEVLAGAGCHGPGLWRHQRDSPEESENMSLR